MSGILALAQCRKPHEDAGCTEKLVLLIKEYATRAKDNGADVVAFPESLMTAYTGSPEQFAAEAQPLNGPFASALATIAAQTNLWIVCTLNETNLDGGLPFNTAVIMDAAGTLQGVYRKTHLFDAQGEKESDHMAAGNSFFEPLETPIGKLGLGICYDLRFPEHARAAALAGAEVILYPASWVDGAVKKQQWETLLSARAIENGLFVAGCGSVNNNRIGSSAVYAPDGRCLKQAPASEETLICQEIDLAAIDTVRTATPSLVHRRTDLY